MPPARPSLGEFALLIRGARVFGPDELGARDVLVAASQVVAVEPETAWPGEWTGLREVDARGLLLLPGLVDGHIHPLGGGGDGGPHTRNRELLPSDLTTSGITTMMGMLVDEALELRQVYARGRLMVNAGRPVVRGRLEGEA